MELLGRGPSIKAMWGYLSRYPEDFPHLGILGCLSFDELFTVIPLGRSSFSGSKNRIDLRPGFGLVMRSKCTQFTESPIQKPSETRVLPLPKQRFWQLSDGFLGLAQQ